MLLEREGRIASAWHRHYDRLRLHTTKTHSGLPLGAWPKAAPRYPTRQHVLQYLQAYAAEHGLAPRFGIAVYAVRRRGDGCGNSGAEIALDLAEQGVNVAMVVRGPVHVIPRDILGRPTQHTSIMLSRLPLGLRDAVGTGITRLVVGDLSRFGIVRPATGPSRMIQESGRFPILDIGTIAMVKQGKIRILPAVQEILSDRVRFAGGVEHPFEAIIFATGYRSGLDELIEGFDEISDERGRPHRFGEETEIPGLYFVGFRNPATGALREIALEAPRVARSIRAAMGAQH